MQLLSKRRPEPVVEPMPPAIASEAEAKQVADAIADQRADVAELRREHSALTAERSDLLVRRALGEAVDPDARRRLADRMEALEQADDEACAAIEQLDTRLQVWRQGEMARVRERNVAKLTELSALGLRQEQAYMQALEALVAAAVALNTTRQAFRSVAAGTKDHRQREPMKPVLPPESFLRRLDPPVPLPQWVKERRDVYGFGEES